MPTPAAFQNLTNYQSGQPLTPPTLVGPGPIGYVATAAGIATAGIGYSVGDLLPVQGGVFTSPAVVQVTGIYSSGQIQSVTLYGPGSYTVLPASPVSVQYDGIGTGATFDLSFQAVSITQSTVDYTYAVVPFPGPPPDSPIQAQANQYLVYDVDTYIQEDQGYLLQPIAGPAGTQAQIARVHGGAGVKVVIFRAVRVGAPVEIPSANTQNPNETLAFRSIGGQATGALPDGTPIFQNTAVYVYFLRTMPVEGTDNITVGVLPFSTNEPQTDDIAPGNYDGQIIAPSTLPLGAPSTPLDY